MPKTVREVEKILREVESNAREAVRAHVELLRSTGRAVPEPTTHDVGRIAV